MNPDDDLGLRLREHLQLTAQTSVPGGFVDAVSAAIHDAHARRWRVWSPFRRPGMHRTRLGGDHRRLLPALALVGATALMSAGILIVGSAPSSHEPRSVDGPRLAVTGSLVTPRADAAAVRLDDGRVLVVGGRGGEPGTDLAALDSAEIFDPATGTWIATGSMMQARVHPAAALLHDGSVLVTGGHQRATWNVAIPPGTATAEIWSPDTGAFTPVTPMLEGRAGHTLTTLDDGRVLVLGGSGSIGTGGDAPHVARSSAELWDPATQAFGPTFPLQQARYQHVVLPLGADLIVAGGWWTRRTGWGEVEGVEGYGDDLAFFWSERLTDVNAQVGAALPDGRIVLCCTWRAGSEAMVILSTDDALPVTELVPVGWYDRPDLDVTLLAALPDGRVVAAWRDDEASSGIDVLDVATGETSALTVAGPADSSEARALRMGGITVPLADGRVLLAGGMEALSPDEAERTDSWWEVPDDAALLVEP